MDHSRHQHHHAKKQSHSHRTDKDSAPVHHHDKHAGHRTSDFLKRFWICLLLTIPVLLLSHMIQQWLGFELRFRGSTYLVLAISTIIYFYGGWPFLAGMVREIRDKSIGMMTLVALAISVAFIYSVAIVFGLEGMDFFWELATLIDIMLLGHWLEMRSQHAASRALESLVALLPSRVHVEKNGEIVEVDLNEIKKGDVVLIRPGEKIPADGTIINGTSYVNESMLTGESLPVKKESNSSLIGGSINGDGSLKVRVTGTGSESYLNKIITMVESAQSAKSKTQHLADRVAKWLTIVSITIGIATFAYWFYAGDNHAFALERMVTVMVTACPHALGVAIPLVVAISTSSAAVNGLLIRNRTSFENSRRLTMIIFDKTGTVTEGSHKVTRIIALSNKYSQDDLLQMAAAVEQHSEHYIARAIMNESKARNLSLWSSSGFKYMQGMGVSGNINGREILVGGPNYFRHLGLVMPNIPADIDQEVETVSFVMEAGEPVGVIAMADSVRPGAAEAMQSLKKMRIKSFLLTGDNEKVASAVANQLKMDGFLANVLPHDKQSKVKEMQAGGEVVAMTGDGVNDAPALAQADVGIAVGSGTDVAAETADIILVNSDPRDVVKLIAFGKATYRKMIENLVWAAGYNIVAIPLAAGVFSGLGFVLSPAMGAVLMSLSTIIVAFNAQLLRRKL